MSSRNGSVTDGCVVCGGPLTGRQRATCSDACRQAAWRRRHQPAAAAAPLPPAGLRRTATVYECGGCGSRLLGEQYCPDCATFMSRVGHGGHCPSCDEPIAVSELIDLPVTAAT